MLNSLSSMLFGKAEQESPESNAATNENAAMGHAQDQQNVNLRTVDDEMGWVRVDLPRSSSPSPLESQGEDTSLRRPDGTVFDGVLDLSSSSSSESEDVEDGYDVATGRFEIFECRGTDDDTDMSSSCSSLSVIEESDEMESYVNNIEDCVEPAYGLVLLRDHTGRCYKIKSLNKAITESWMITPPPCFTGTDVNCQLKSSPLENELIEYASVFARRTSSEGQNSFYDRIFSVRKERSSDPSRQTSAAGDRARGGQEPQNSSKCRHQRAMLTVAGHTASMTECCGAAHLKKETPILQDRQKAAAATKKFLTRNCMQRSNKARMVQSCSRKQTSARNRLLRPSGSKCGRFTQRAQ
ncbi:uncharacterized protein LOC143285397 [Babylonia areolata]|uniref:uncharacterized protein LOC143285397 n=1 Tax=Babylonia areolata TaxID=304850 RepID=UPI003FD14132